MGEVTQSGSQQPGMGAAHFIIPFPMGKLSRHSLEFAPVAARREDACEQFRLQQEIGFAPGRTGRQKRMVEVVDLTGSMGAFGYAIVWHRSRETHSEARSSAKLRHKIAVLGTARVGCLHSPG